MISTVHYHVFGYEITMYYYVIHRELSFVRYTGAVYWSEKLLLEAMAHRGQPPLFMAYWLWAAVYLFVVVADAVAAGAFFVYHGPHRAVLISYPKLDDIEKLNL